MNEFTASNGRQISAESDATRIFNEAGRNMLESFAHLDTQDMQALREFFQAEADEGLGRWRWTENPDYVVYPAPDEEFERMFGPGLDLVILRESDGMTKGYVRAEDQGGPPAAHRADHMLAARAYFDAHSEPKPWHDAKPGQVWALRLNDADEDLFFVHGDGEFHFRDGDHIPNRLSITSGRRIWPEEVTS